MNVSTLVDRVNQATGRELVGYLPDGRKWVLRHGDPLADWDLWDCWIYVGESITYDLHWSGETIDEVLQRGEHHYNVDLLTGVVR